MPEFTLLTTTYLAYCAWLGHRLDTDGVGTFIVSWCTVTTLFALGFY